MGFSDRLERDVSNVFLGSRTHEVDVTYATRSGGSGTTIKAVIDVDSFQTGTAAENEFNPSIEAAAYFYIDDLEVPNTPVLNDQITTADGKVWRVQHTKLEGGMWSLFATSEHRRRRRG